MERRGITPGNHIDIVSQGLILSCGPYLPCHIDVFSHFLPIPLDKKDNGVRVKASQFVST